MKKSGKSAADVLQDSELQEPCPAVEAWCASAQRTRAGTSRPLVGAIKRIARTARYQVLALAEFVGQQCWRERHLQVFARRQPRRDRGGRVGGLPRACAGDKLGRSTHECPVVSGDQLAPAQSADKCFIKNSCSDYRLAELAPGESLFDKGKETTPEMCKYGTISNKFLVPPSTEGFMEAAAYTPWGDNVIKLARCQVLSDVAYDLESDPERFKSAYTAQLRRHSH